MPTNIEPDTIYALSSGALPSGVAIVRVSGSGVLDAMDRMLGQRPQPRTAVLCRFNHPESGELLDEGLALYFEKPNSFTGEDVLELHCHGGLATVEAVLAALSGLSGLRAAERGEFSRRAFENGRLDLTELEGLSDLVAAQTEKQRKLALVQSTGSLRKLYDDWRSQLIRARALIEAELDFADEDDVPGSVSARVWKDVAALQEAIAVHVSDDRAGELIRSGFRIALLGAPNAGKSSVLNALAKRDVAIVTPQAGTTRDVIEVSLNIKDHLVVVSDTAGLREADDIVEQEGIRRARKTADEADLNLWLRASDDPVDKPDGLDAVVVQTKIDLADNGGGSELGVHTLEPEGIAPLFDFLKSEISIRMTMSEEPVLTRRRHRDALNATIAALDSVTEQSDIELKSEHLRQAADALGRITGRIDVEDLLDVIFSEFCIGK